MARQYLLPASSSKGDDWISEEEFRTVVEKYAPRLIKRMGEMAASVGGHGGMDTLMDWRLIDCLQNGLPLDMAVYDAALWSAVGPLSEESVAYRSSSVEVPDFTSGSWKANASTMHISLKESAARAV